MEKINENKSAICVKFTSNICVFTLEKEVNSTDDILSTKCIPKQYKRSKGDGKLKKQHEYVVNDKLLKLYAWEEEKDPGFENKSELPPPLAENLYYGNIYIVGFDKNNKLISITKEDYKDMTVKFFEGFENLGSEDSWSTEESLQDDDSLHDFIIQDE